MWIHTPHSGFPYSNTLSVECGVLSICLGPGLLPCTYLQCLLVALLELVDGVINLLSHLDLCGQVDNLRHMIQHPGARLLCLWCCHLVDSLVITTRHTTAVSAGVTAVHACTTASFFWEKNVCVVPFVIVINFLVMTPL